MNIDAPLVTIAMFGVVIFCIGALVYLFYYFDKFNKNQEKVQEEIREADRRPSRDVRSTPQYNPATLGRIYTEEDRLRDFGDISTATQRPTHYRSRYIPSLVKQAVWARDGGKCVDCGSNYDLEYDHMIPHSRGGSNSENNIQLLCFNCNRTKSAKIM